MKLTTQAAQVAWFRNVAAYLEPGGCFVIEVMIPDLLKLPSGQNVVPFHVSATEWAAFDIYDIATRTMGANYVEVIDSSGERRSPPFRHVWAGRTRPDGPTRRAATARALGRVETGTLHEREPPACLDLGQARG